MAEFPSGMDRRFPRGQFPEDDFPRPIPEEVPGGERRGRREAAFHEPQQQGGDLQGDHSVSTPDQASKHSLHRGLVRRARRSLRRRSRAARSTTSRAARSATSTVARSATSRAARSATSPPHRDILFYEERISRPSVPVVLRSQSLQQLAVVKYRFWAERVGNREGGGPLRVKHFRAKRVGN